MLLKNYKFKFKLFPTLIFAIAFCGFVVLGFWQIDRADQKNVLNSNYTDRQQEATIVLDKNNIMDEKSSLLWRKVEFEGSFLNKQNIMNTVANLGTALTESQIQLIWRFFNNIII